MLDVIYALGPTPWGFISLIARPLGTFISVYVILRVLRVTTIT